MVDKSANKTSKRAYRVLVGLDTVTADGEPVRYESGDMAPYIPASSLGWLLGMHVVEVVENG